MELREKLKAGLVLGAAVLGVVGMQNPARGAGVQDQTLVVTSPTFDAAIASSVSRAQTFTVGMDGVLSDVGLQIYSSDGTGPNPTLFVARTDAGSPQSIHTLYSATIPMASIPINGGGLGGSVAVTNFSLGSAGFAVKVGDVLTVGVHRPGTATGSLLWRTAGQAYSGGAFHSQTSGTWSAYNSGLQDSGFRDLVDLMPVYRGTPAADGEATWNGSSFTVSGGDNDINTQKVGATDRRGILEFNLGSIPSGRLIKSATLTLDLNAITYSGTDFPQVKVFAYSGDGALSPLDALQNSVLAGVAQATQTTLESLDIVLTPAVIQSARTSGYLGLLLVGSDNGHQTGFWTSEAAGSPGISAPTLNLAYAPEPGGLVIVVMMVSALTPRQRRRPSSR